MIGDIHENITPGSVGMREYRNQNPKTDAQGFPGKAERFNLIEFYGILSHVDSSGRELMEPISMLMAALVAGAGTALKDTAGQAVKDTYQGLKKLIIDRWGKKDEAELLLRKHEENPEAAKALLESEFKKLKFDQNKDILELAKTLLAQADPDGAAKGKYHLTIQDAKGVQIGDHNVQKNDFQS